jgi:hypothetical protein
MASNVFIKWSKTEEQQVAHPYLYICIYGPLLWISLKIKTDLEINKITTYILLSTSISFSTERIALLNSKVNPRKYKYPCQVDDYPSEQVFTKEHNQLIKLLLVC